MPHVARLAIAVSGNWVTARAVIARALRDTVGPPESRATRLGTIAALPAGGARALSCDDVTGGGVLALTERLTALAVCTFSTRLLAQRSLESQCACTGSGHVMTGGVVFATTLVLTEVAIVTFRTPRLAFSAHVTWVTDTDACFRVTGAVTVTVTHRGTVVAPSALLTVVVADFPAPSRLTATVVRRHTPAPLTGRLAHRDARVTDWGVTRTTHRAPPVGQSRHHLVRCRHHRSTLLTSRGNGPAPGVCTLLSAHLCCDRGVGQVRFLHGAHVTAGDL